MSKRIYSLKREKSAEFPLFDGSAWFKEVSNQEFGTLVTNGQVRHSNGRFFATSSFAEAKAAAEGLDPTDYSYDDPETPPSPESRERSGGGIYPNPGATLKGIATLICVLGMVASVILQLSSATQPAYWAILILAYSSGFLSAEEYFRISPASDLPPSATLC